MKAISIQSMSNCIRKFMFSFLSYEVRMFHLTFSHKKKIIDIYIYIYIYIYKNQWNAKTAGFAEKTTFNCDVSSISFGIYRVNKYLKRFHVNFLTTKKTDEVTFLLVKMQIKKHQLKI